MPQRTASKRDVGYAQRGGAVRDVAREVRVELRRVAEALELLLGEVGVGVGGREVAHQADDLDRRDGSSARPKRPIPVSSLRWIGTPGRQLAVGDDELEPRLARRADLAVAGGPMTMIRAVGNSRRSASASPSVTTQSAVAPSSSAAPATSVAPWP